MLWPLPRRARRPRRRRRPRSSSTRCTEAAATPARRTGRLHRAGQHQRVAGERWTAGRCSTPRSTGTWQMTDLPASCRPAAATSSREAPGTGGTTDVPADVDGTIAMAGTGRQGGPGQQRHGARRLARAPRPAPARGLPQVVDFVGCGTANDFAGTGPTPAPSNTASVTRNAAHAQHRRQRRRLRWPARPSPTACGTTCTTAPAAGREDDRRDPGHRPTTPLSGQTVTTKGVVTAAYPTGGFHGFYLQTQGTGPEPSCHRRLGRVFVFQPRLRRRSTPTSQVGNYVQVTGEVSEFQLGHRPGDSDRAHRVGANISRRRRRLQPGAGADRAVAHAPTPGASRSRACSSSPPAPTR